MPEDHVDLPPLYIDQAVLSDGPLTATSRFLVNDEEFLETPAFSDEGLAEFEVYGMDTEGDMYCSTPSGSESEFGDNHHAELRVTLQQVPNGYIVNGNCYLSTNQWNTLVTPAVSVKLLHCVVCEEYCELEASVDHVKSSEHRAALAACPPLDKFELSVVRKIRDLYHCAICNEIFDISEETEHIDSKMHAGNSLFSINKASDLLYKSLDHSNSSNRSVNEKDTYHFKTHAMNSPTNDSESVGSEHYFDNLSFVNFQDHDYYEEEEPPAFTGLSYATMAKKPKVNTQSFIDVDLGNKTVTVRYDSWNMIIKPNRKANRFWCMVCKKYDHMKNKTEHCNELEHVHNLNKCKVVEEYEDYFIRQVDDKFYHCGHCNNLQMIHEMEDHVDSVHPKKKTTDINRNIRNSPDIRQDTHVAKNTNINMNNAVNITNNTPNNSPRKLQPSSLFTKNIARDSNNSSPVKNIKNMVQNSNNPSPVKNMTGDTDHSNNINKINVNVNVDKKPSDVTNQNGGLNNGLTHVMPGIFDDIVIYPFGSKITVPSLAYNVCCKRPRDFYCGLCAAACAAAAIARHVYEVQHLELLHRTPFILPFSNNLIRAIRDALHCAICNIPIPATKIYGHIQEVQHIEALNKALNTSQPPKLPPIGVKIPNVPETLSAVRPSSGLGPKSPVLNNTNGVNRVQNAENPRTNNSNHQTVFEIPSNNVNVSQPSVDTHKTKERNFEVYHRAVTNEEVDTEIDNIVDDYDEEGPEEYYNETESDDEELERTFESLASEDASFDEEEHVYLKLKNTYVKISNTSYNTLVHVGDGSRYCFVCAVQVEYSELQKHVDGRPHLENMEKYMFLDKYEDHFLRQIYLMYHCAICNVIVTRKELKTHLEWPTHALHNVTLKNIKKTRKIEIKGGVKQIVVSTQKENIYLHENEPKIKIGLNAQICNKRSPKAAESGVQSKPEVGFCRKNKIIIFNDNVLKVPWDGWHAISKIKNGLKCVLCQRDVKSADVDAHCTSEWHRYGLDKPFEKQHAPALIRKINESTLNCLFCNTEISNKDHLVQVHVNGKKHIKNYEDILKDSSLANTYTDCHDDVLML